MKNEKPPGKRVKKVRQGKQPSRKSPDSQSDRSAVRDVPDVVLLAVTGMSPAVLTETIWALAHEPEPVVPARVIVITTTGGREAIVSTLFKSESRFGGMSPWDSLRADLSGRGFDLKDKLQFGTTGQDIRVFTTADATTGRTNELPDLRTPADNEAAADFLLDQIRAVVENPDRTLIASLAGGRKTMGALLYACLTLVGRESDRLTHVLVNEPFETLREFWFPTQPGGALTDREGRAHDPARSCVELASVPFVPLRNLFQRDLTRKPGSFRSLIARCSQKVEALARSEMHLELAVDQPEMRVNGVTVKLSVAEYTVIYYLVNAIKKGEPPIGSYDCAANPMTLAAQDLYGQRDPNDFGDWRYKAKPENRGFDAIDDRWITKNVSNLREKLRANARTAALARLLPTRHRFSLDLPANRVGLLSGS